MDNYPCYPFLSGALYDPRIVLLYEEIIPYTSGQLHWLLISHISSLSSQII